MKLWKIATRSPIQDGVGLGSPQSSRLSRSAFQSGVDGRWQTAGRLISPAWSGGRSHSHAPPLVSEAARTLSGGLHTNPRRVDSRCTVLAARPKVSDEEMDQRKEQLRELLCATKAEIDELVRSNPRVLYRRDIVASYGPKLEMLQERLGLSQKVACKMSLSCYKLLSCVSLETLESKIEWLQARLTLSKAQLRKIIGRAPGILALSTDENIEPTLANIQSYLKLSDKELTKLVVKAPVRLTNDCSTEKLSLRLSFLRDLLNIEEREIGKLQKAIMRKPDILHWPEKRMVEVRHWIAERLGLNDSRIAQTCRNMPDTHYKSAKNVISRRVR